MRLTIILGCALVPLTAAPIEITERSLVTIRNGAELTAEIGIWSYGRNNPTGSPYPTEIHLTLISPDITDRFTAVLPGTNVEYFPGFLFEGRLESQGGALSVPLVDPAYHLGLRDGYLPVKRATVMLGSGEQIQVAVLDAVILLPPETSEALFGANVRSYAAAARVRLRNLGADFTVGIDKSRDVRSAIVVHSIRGSGTVETGGIVGRVTLENLQSCVSTKLRDQP
jgi:hypothetical protein